MSGRIGVKKEDVFLACEELVKKSEYVTVANVRKELGTGMPDFTGTDHPNFTGLTTPIS